MHNGSKILGLALRASIALVLPAFFLLPAQSAVCVKDLNHDGVIDQITEHFECSNTTPPLCPLDAIDCNAGVYVVNGSATLPPGSILGKSGFTRVTASSATNTVSFSGWKCTATSCGEDTAGRISFSLGTVTGAAQAEKISRFIGSGNRIDIYGCKDLLNCSETLVGSITVSGAAFSGSAGSSDGFLEVSAANDTIAFTGAACGAAGCSAFAAGEIRMQGVEYSCPLGRQFSCVNVGNAYRCSPNSCFDESMGGQIQPGQRVCSRDLNGDGFVDINSGEIVNCTNVDGQEYCPLGAKDCLSGQSEAYCPNDGTDCPPGGVYVEARARCETNQVATAYRCPNTATTYALATDCNAACRQSADCSNESVATAGTGSFTAAGSGASALVTVVSSGNCLVFKSRTGATLGSTCFSGTSFTFSGAIQTNPCDGTHQMLTHIVPANGGTELWGYFCDNSGCARLQGCAGDTRIVISGGAASGGETLQVATYNNHGDIVSGTAVGNALYLYHYAGDSCSGDGAVCNSRNDPGAPIYFNGIQAVCPLGEYPCSAGKCSSNLPCTPLMGCIANYHRAVDICAAGSSGGFGGTLNPVRDVCEVLPVITCPAGYNYDSVLDTCIVNTQCPAGGQMDTDLHICVKSIDTDSCPSGFVYYAGYDACLKRVECPEGGIYNSGALACQTVSTPVCSAAGYSYDPVRLICQASPVCSLGAFDGTIDKCRIEAATLCPAGFAWNGADDNCQIEPPCPAGSSYSAGIAMCLSDPTHSCLRGGAFNPAPHKCQMDPGCDLGVFDGAIDKCRIEAYTLCLAGFTFNGPTDRCEITPSCPAGSDYSPVNDTCVEPPTHSCPDGGDFNAIVHQCQLDPICIAGTFDAAIDKCRVEASTLCPGAYTYNPLTDKCEQAPLCPAGSSYSVAADTCEETAGHSCDAGGVFVPGTHLCEGAAWYTCADGYSYDAGQSLCYAASTCSSGGTLDTANDVCYVGYTNGCPGGYVYVPARGTCEIAPPCPAPGSYNAARDRCETSPSSWGCPAGYNWYAPWSLCIASPSCPSGGSYNGSWDACTASASYYYSCPLGGNYGDYGTCAANCVQSGTCSQHSRVSSTAYCYQYATGDSGCGSGPGNFCWNTSYTPVTCPIMTFCPAGGEGLWGYWDHIDWIEGCATAHYRIYYNNTYVYYWTCSLTGSEYGDSGTCAANCSRTVACTGPTYYCWGAPWQLSGSTCDYAPGCPAGGSLNGGYDYCVASGTPNCPAGYAWDADNGVCQAAVSCPSGGTLSGARDMCQASSFPVCNAAEYSYVAGRNRCEAAPACPAPGTYNGANDQCHAARINNCPAHYTYDAGRDLCVENPTHTCALAGFVYSAALDFCVQAVTCPEGGSLNGAADLCEILFVSAMCPPGGFTYNAARDICEKDPDCSAGFSYSAARDKCEKASFHSCDLPGFAYEAAIDYCTQAVSCPSGASLNPVTDLCEVILDTSKCPGSGFVYNAALDICEKGPLCAFGFAYSADRDKCEIEPVHGCAIADFIYDAIIDYCKQVVTCPSGAILNAGTNLCEIHIDTSKCPPGFVYNAALDICEKDPACDSGGTFVGDRDRCELAYINDCPAGYGWDNASGFCRMVPEPVCDEGAYDTVLAMCSVPGQDLCPASYTFKPADDRCEATPPCPEPGTYSSSLDLCVSEAAYDCPNTYTYDQTTKQCAAAPLCFEGNYDPDQDKCTGGVQNCPYGEQYACITNPVSGIKQCTDIQCFMMTSMPTQQNQIDLSSYHNDGKINESTGECEGQVLIFNGQASECRTGGRSTNFFNCCDTSEGAFGPIKEVCGEQDQKTMGLVAAGVCHYLGDYCKEKWPLIGCVQKANVYCCFNSKLGRIIQEQGRGQLKKFPAGFGSAESPDCRGFTAEEFQMLDFSQIDLSEYFGDIVTRAQQSIITDMGGNIQNFYQNTR
ncbi:MAG: conjugal transfer protein TraN [Syntrophales bacterium]